jgi:PKD repeat protein
MRVAVSGSLSSLAAAGGWLLLTAAGVSAAQAQTPTLGTCIARYSVTTVWLSAPGIYQYGTFNDAYDAGNAGAPYTDPNFNAGRYGVNGHDYGELVGERYVPPTATIISQLCPELGRSYVPTTEDRFDLVYVSYPPGHSSAIFDTLFSGGGQLPGVPVSNFSWSPATVYQGVPVSFIDTSSGQPTTAWSWTFPNASPTTSNVEDPSNVIFTSTGNQQVTMQASNATGPSSNVASQVVQVLSPVPAVSSIVITPSSPFACQAVSFAAVGAAGEPPLEYAWNVTQGGVSVFSSTAAAPTWSATANANAALYEVGLTLTNPQNTELSATAQAAFTLQALPALSVQTPTNDPFSGGTVQFHVVSTGAATWSWAFGDGTPPYTSSDPTLGPSPPAHTYNASGSYNVTATVSSCAPGSLTSQALTVQVNLSNPLTAMFTAVCAFAPCTFAATSPIAFDDFSVGATQWDYDWNNTGATSTTCNFTDGPGTDVGHTAPATSHTYAAAGTYQPCLRVGNGSGAQNIDVSPPLVVVPSGPATLTIAGPASGLLGTAYTFTASAANCTAAAQWNWQTDGTVDGSALGSSIMVTWTVTGPHTLTVTNTGCAAAQSSATITISTITQPASIVVTGPATGTVGTAASFTATAANCTPAAAWSWNVAGGSVSGSSTGSSIAISWATTGSYTLSATNSACGGASGSATIAIGPGSLGSSFVFSPASPGQGSPVSFDGSASTGSPTSYYWTFGDGGIDGSGAVVSHTYSTAGTYTVQLSVSKPDSAADCVAVGGFYYGGSCTVTSSRTVSVAPPPPPQLTAVIMSAACQGPSTALICTSVIGDNVAFASGNNNGAAGWTWNFGDGTTASGESISHAWSTPGHYTVTLTVTGGAAQSASASAAVTIVGLPTYAQVLPWIWPANGTKVMSRNFYAFNPGTTPMTLTVQFLRRGDVPTQSIVIPPLQTFVATDPLGLFTPRVRNGPGFLEFTWSSPTGAVPVLGGESGIYTGGNAEPDLGQTIAATMVVQDPSQASASQPPLHLIGLAESADKMTAIGLSDPFPEPAFVNIHFFDAAGNAVGTPVLDLEIGQEGLRPLTSTQLQQTYNVTGEDLHAVIDTLSGGPITAYGLVLPVASQDPSYVSPGATNLAAQYLLGVGTGGSGAAAVATDVLLANPDNVPMQVQMAFVNTLVSVPSPAPVTLTLAPGTTTRILDVLHSQWNIAKSTVGTLIFTSPAAADGIYPIIRGESYSTSLSPASRVGSVIPAQGAGPAGNLTLLNLQKDSSHLTTLWFFNTSPTVATFNVVYLNSSGNVLGAKRGIQLGPGKMGRLRPADHPIPASVPGGFTVLVRPIAGTLLAAGLVQNTATGGTTYVGPPVQ